ncbi:Uma2 family endonuclease [Spirulina sp. CCNP1310]|uniref:Uma2 family endonuclease n=1 Tax=Spirulina sp. CCNP1310 TaxID=3110249 RepID=UPI002B21692F|nr:Uma2 family endonuclease [Spirulina sp. CCNP1310]MEA5417976.1 Uma2 family endonuclease [Spirulina sp. CCNP1310]
MIALDLRPTLQLTNAAFAQLCASNPDLRLERTAQGELSVIAPAGSDSGRQNASITGQLWYWNRQTRLGLAFDSSAGFTLPNSAIRSPDAAWIAQSRWDALTPEQRRTFAPICPDFVIELKSPSDTLPPLQAKLTEYIANGAQLGWLIDPEGQQVHCYRPNHPPEILTQPTTISAHPILPNFTLDLTLIWN